MVLKFSSKLRFIDSRQFPGEIIVRVHVKIILDIFICRQLEIAVILYSPVNIQLFSHHLSL